MCIASFRSKPCEENIIGAPAGGSPHQNDNDRFGVHEIKQRFYFSTENFSFSSANKVVALLSTYGEAAFVEKNNEGFEDAMHILKIENFLR